MSRVPAAQGRQVAAAGKFWPECVSGNSIKKRKLGAIFVSEGKQHQKRKLVAIFVSEGKQHQKRKLGAIFVSEGKQHKLGEIFEKRTWLHKTIEQFQAYIKVFKKLWPECVPGETSAQNRNWVKFFFEHWI